MPRTILSTSILCLTLAAELSAQTQVVSVNPAMHSIHAGVDETITIKFRGSMISDQTLQKNIFIYGSQSGLQKQDMLTVTRDVDEKKSVIVTSGFKPGELISVIIREIMIEDNNFHAQSYQWQFSVRPESGTGEFKRRTELNLASGSRPAAVFAADMNNSLAPDIAVLDGRTGRVSIFENAETNMGLGFELNPVRELEITSNLKRGAGKNSGELQASSDPAFPHITGTDILGYGYTSLIVTSRYTDEIVIHSNQGGDKFYFDPAKPIQTGSGPIMSAAADFNNDGKMDIAVLAAGSEQVLVHTNESFFKDTITLPAGGAPASFVARDFTGNGYIDIAVAFSDDHSIRLYKNNGNLTFDDEPIITNLAFEPEFMLAANISGMGENGEFGDEFVDIAVGSANSSHLEIYAFDRSISEFSWRESLAALPAAGLAAADFFGNTALDLLAVHPGNDQISLFINQGNEKFSQPALSIDPDAAGFGTGIATADFSLNGAIDIAVTNTDSDKVTILYNEGGSRTPASRNGQISAWPNPFTPNDDGFNDQTGFSFADADVQNPVLEVFNFEGRHIRTNRNMEGSKLFWDGYDDNGRMQLPGVYIYVIKDGSKAIASGIVTLAR